MLSVKKYEHYQLGRINRVISLNAQQISFKIYLQDFLIGYRVNGYETILHRTTRDRQTGFND
jgi:hypothetical protein